ncbi:R3HCL-like protein [Mya arenaria]|uniref:R3HCL-like protein n=1 Tax=Mya arenaria TaxID=6604 RepID=A0ABY7FIU2_MYAAR|nr:R3HCL-like protein [Mya arenaria]
MKGRGRAKFRDNPDRPGGSPAGREGYNSGDNERRDSPVNWQSDTNRWQHDRYTDNKADNSSPGQQDWKQGSGAENNGGKYEYGHDTGRWSQDNDCGRMGSPYGDSFGNPDSPGLRTGSPVLDHQKWDDSPRFSALERGRNSTGIVDQAGGNKDGGIGRGRLSAGERGRNSPVIAGQAGEKSAGRGRPERSRNKRPDVQVYVPRARRQQPQEQQGQQCHQQAPSTTRDQTPNHPTQNKQPYESPVHDMKSSPSLKSHSHEHAARDSGSSTLSDGHNNFPSLKSHSHGHTTRDSVSSSLSDDHNNSQSQGLSSKSSCQSTERSGKSYSDSHDMPLMTEKKTSTIQKKKEMERYVPRAKLQGIAEPKDDLINDREAKRLKGEENIEEIMDDVENNVTSTATSKESTESETDTVTGDNLFRERVEHTVGFGDCTDKGEESQEGDIESISDDKCHLVDGQTLGASEEDNTLDKAGEHFENENNINLDRERTECHRQFEDMQASFDKDAKKNIDGDENILQNENSDVKEMVIDTTTYQELEGMDYTGNNDDDIVEANGDAIHNQLVTDEFDNGAIDTKGDCVKEATVMETDRDEETSIDYGAGSRTSIPDIDVDKELDCVESNTICIEKTEDFPSSFELGAMSEPIQIKNKSYTNNSQNDVVVVRERTHEEESAIKDRLENETRSQDFQSLESTSANEFNQSANLDEPIGNESVNKHENSKQIEKGALDQCQQTICENSESEDTSVQKPKKIKKASKVDKKKTKTVKILKKTKMKPDSKTGQKNKDQEQNIDSGQKPVTAGAAVERVVELAGEEDEEEDSWDAKFDDDGECLDPEALEELTRTVGEVQIEKSKTINYLDYQPRDKADFDVSNYNHVIEIYDFPAEFVTRDLITAFQSFMSRGFDLKWVDDTHALGIFSSSIAEFLKPYKPRPETTASAARRLVAGALGLATNVSKEKREKERQQLKEAKEKRRQARTNREQIWEFGKCAMDEES